MLKVFKMCILLKATQLSSQDKLQQLKFESERERERELLQYKRIGMGTKFPQLKLLQSLGKESSQQLFSIKAGTNTF